MARLVRITARRKNDSATDTVKSTHGSPGASLFPENINITGDSLEIAREHIRIDRKWSSTQIEHELTDLNSAST